MTTTTKPTSPGSAAPEGAPITPRRIIEFAWGFAPPLIIEAAVRHRVFDVLNSGGPQSLDELARATGASTRGLRAILDALVGLELLTRQADRYALTPESATFLVSSKPAFHGGFVKHLNGQILNSWKNLADIVTTGKPATEVNDQETGAAFFREFVEDLLPINFAAARVLADHLAAKYEGQPMKVIDLAAGSGVWGIAFAQRSPQARITAVDWPKVAEITQDVAKRFGVGDRLSTLPGDLQEVDFGRGYQVATLGHILHSEGEARSRKLLAKVFDALTPGGTIAIAEFTPNDDRTAPPIPLLFGVNMLVHTHDGDVFTFPQISSWLREAGFKDVRQLEAPAPSPLILATKP
ncbi:MAG TPA: class I SAM-dependent methyltransferase [Tepidisphaeraceae bacterium]|jgi:ubiquinone/menaquinone biosynthesis C-methylase UbiE